MSKPEVAKPEPLTGEQVAAALSGLNIVSFEFRDCSRYHKGHSGNPEGKGHYELIVVSDDFAGRSRLARHRLIYQQFSEVWQAQIHALNLKLYTIREWRESAEGRDKEGAE